MIGALALQRPGVRGRPLQSPAVGGRLAVAVAAAGVITIPLIRPTGPGNSSPADVAIVLALLTALLWAGTTMTRLRLPYAAAVAVMAASGSLAALTSRVPGTGLLTVVQDLYLLALAAMIANLVRTPWALSALLRTWAWSGIGWAGLLVLAVARGDAALSGISSRYGGRAAITFADPNMAASYFVLTLMVLWATRTPANRLLRWSAYALLLTALVMTGSNGGIVSLLLAVAVATVVTAVQRAGLVATIAGLCLTVLVAAVATTTIDSAALQRWARDSQQPLIRDSIGRSDRSVFLRQLLLNETISFYQDGGLTGWGPSATKAELTARQATFAREAHDDYVAALVERGPVGALGLLILMGSIAWRTGRLAARGLTAEFARVVPHVAPLVGAVVAVAIAATFYEVLHFRQTWLLFGVIAGLSIWSRR